MLRDVCVCVCVSQWREAWIGVEDRETRVRLLLLLYGFFFWVILMILHTISENKTTLHVHTHKKVLLYILDERNVPD